jgi:hypothetical protein
MCFKRIKFEEEKQQKSRSRDCRKYDTQLARGSC